MAVSASDKRLVQLLVQDGKLSREDGEALLGQAARFGGLDDSLVMSNDLDGQTFLEYKAKALGVARADFRGTRPDTLKEILPSHLAEERNVFPLKLEVSPGGEVLHVATTNPADLQLMDDLRFKTGRRIQPALAGLDEITGNIQAFYYNMSGLDLDTFVVDTSAGSDADDEPLDLTEEVPDEPPVIEQGYNPFDLAPAAAAPIKIDTMELEPLEPLEPAPLSVPFDDAMEIGLDIPDDLGRGGMPAEADVGLVGGSGINPIGYPEPAAPYSSAPWGTNVNHQTIRDELYRALSGREFDPTVLPHPNILLVAIARALAPNAGMPPEQLTEIIVDTLSKATTGT